MEDLTEQELDLFFAEHLFSSKEKEKEKEFEEPVMQFVQEESMEPAGFVPNKEQQEVIDAVSAGLNVFFTGSAGTGKTKLIEHLTKTVLHRGPVTLGSLLKNVAVTATTGTAAFLLGGSTVHWYTGIGIRGDKTSAYEMEKYLRGDAKERILSLGVLIIDEISILSAAAFDLLNMLFCNLRRDSRPFGGVQLLCSGDFFQLPPINGSFAFEAAAWSLCFENPDNGRMIELKEVHRQHDQEFVAILNHIRKSEPTPEIIEKLQIASQISEMKASQGKYFTKLYSHNKSADNDNDKKLEQLPDEPRIYTHHADGNKSFIDNCPYPATLKLKKGARVMLLRNLDVFRGLVNGAQGVVVGFERVSGYASSEGIWPKVAFRVSRNVFGRGTEYTITELILPVTWDFRDGKGKVLASVVQLPIRLSWSSTIHKTQGITIDGVEVDLNGCFAEGQVYVALSRAISLDGLIVRNIDKKWFKVNDKVRAFDARMRGEGDAITSPSPSSSSSRKRRRIEKEGDNKEEKEEEGEEEEEEEEEKEEETYNQRSTKRARKSEFP